MMAVDLALTTRRCWAINTFTLYLLHLCDSPMGVTVTSSLQMKKLVLRQVEPKVTPLGRAGHRLKLISSACQTLFQSLRGCLPPRARAPLPGPNSHRCPIKTFTGHVRCARRCPNCAALNPLSNPRRKVMLFAPRYGQCN